MSKSILLVLFLLLCNASGVVAQTVSGNFKDVSFLEFIEEVEGQTDYVFFFREDVITPIHFSKEGDSIDVKELIKNVCFVYHLQYYYDQKNIIIYEGKKIVEAVYSTSSEENSSTNDIADKEMSDAEKKYFEIKNRKIQNLSVSVGDRKKSVAGKTNFIRGRIIEEGSGNPISNATLYIEDLQTGAITDLDGYFSLVLETGDYMVQVSSLSMKTKKMQLHVLSDGNLQLVMYKELVGLDEVQVVADRHNNVQGSQMGFERLSAKAIKSVPMVMGEKDLLKVAQMLPGIQSAGEGSAGLIVRGGTADQNIFYINSIPVYNTSHLFGFFSAFSPDIVNDFSIYKSHIPAKYGGRISSIFDISTRQGNKKEFYAKGGISPVTGHIAIEGPVVKDKSSFVASYRTTYSDWLLSKVDNANFSNSSASFYDLSLGFNSKIKEKSIFKMFVYNSGDKSSISTTNDYDYGNWGGMMSLKHFFSSKLSADLSLMSSLYEFGYNNKANISEAYRQEYDMRHNEVKVDFLYLSSKNHRLSFGVNSILYNLNRGDITPYGEESIWSPITLSSEKGIESAVYFSDETNLTSRLKLSAGIRLSNYLFLGPQTINEYFPNSPLDEENVKGELTFSENEIIRANWSLEPRVALNYALNHNNSIKTSYNRSAQNVFMLSNTIAMAPTDQWKLADYYIAPPVSNQISLGYYQNFPKKGIETSLEVYGKRTSNIVEYKDGADFISPDPTEMFLLQGEQNTYGLEFMLKKKTGKMTGWLSYTYSKSMIEVSSDIATEQINYGNAYPSNYDIPHSVNFVNNYQYSRRLSLSTNVVYSTGRPITYPIAAYQSEGQDLIAFSGRNQYRIPDYFRVDLSLNIEGNLNRNKFIHSSWSFNVYNVLGRNNAYSVYFENENGQLQGHKLSIFGEPIVTLSWNFKLGNYVSE